ncbi:MAG: hypothetical protein R2698_06300 [Microthrixaceae bacterium]
MIAGRHNPENNMDAIAELYAATDRDLPFVVLGTANYDSPTTANLTALSRRDERIRLLGHIGGRSEFFDLVHHAATYIHGHSVGGTNPSLIEAMGSGARICANDTPFCRETLAGVAPYFSLDQPSFAAAIGSILDDDPGHDAEVRAATRARASDRFNVVDVVTAYRDLLHAAAAARWRTTTISTRWAQST